jgi:hypothetical protein
MSLRPVDPRGIEIAVKILIADAMIAASRTLSDMSERSEAETGVYLTRRECAEVYWAVLYDRMMVPIRQDELTFYV